MAKASFLVKNSVDTLRSRTYRCAATEVRIGWGWVRLGHSYGISYSQRLPSFKALFPRNEFLRVGQPKCCPQNFLIGKQMEPGQVFPDRGSGRIRGMATIRDKMGHLGYAGPILR